ncbi:MAG: phosphoribosylamine--glycine ligase [Melioribacteraceae bacterium]|nr:phosphoribosylamine--glycine ligase [Melioribacteraceae bacterium]
MNVLIIGSGGREHALAYKIRESKDLDKLYISPGNPGTAILGENVTLDNSNFRAVKSFCIKNSIDLVVIGPEQPLVNGMADHLKSSGINVFGPEKTAAEIEGNKSFSKMLMKKYSIPTADFRIFTINQQQQAFDYLNQVDYPVVIKASGLAAGKGVLICNNISEAVSAIKNMFAENLFGESGHTIVIEEFMEGLEASIFAISDGNEYLILPPSQDHKRILDNDEGKNTGGMGAYAPAPLITDELMKVIDDNIIKKTLNALKSEGRIFIGCLYAGIMITKNGPKVVEFNCRFGDPETQVVLPVLEGNLLELLYSASIGKINKNAVKMTGACAVCVVASSEGYPDKYEKGFIISGLEEIDKSDTIVFHAGTKQKDTMILTDGGRVIGVTNINKSGNIKACKQKVYHELGKIYYNGMYYRKDISDKADMKISP